MQLSAGATIAEVSRALGISEQTFHRWRNQYGGMKAEDAKRLRALENSRMRSACVRSRRSEKENARLKRRVAEQALDNQILKEVARGNF